MEEKPVVVVVVTKKSFIMKQYLIIFVFLLLYNNIIAQESPFKVQKEKEIDFLMNYYSQDGNHSPVTGGIGTEKLNCIGPLTEINIPFDSTKNMSVNIGVDYYTSASCNRIDRFVTSASSKFLSSASSKDTRVHVDIDYSMVNPTKHSEKGYMLGFSNEFDVKSISGGFHFSKSDPNDNRQLSIKTSVFYDIWKLIYPGEIRDNRKYRFGNEEWDYDLDQRITSTLSLLYSQVLNKRLHFTLSSDIVYQNGILNTPFHRVYFDDGLNIINPDTNQMLIAKTMFPEKLPRHRYKLPISIRICYYVNDFIITRFYYRFYRDDFGIKANSFNIEIPIKLTSWLMIYPLYRYYRQTASKYFAPFGQHRLDENYQPLETYYTSDFDLSAFTNNKFGGGFRISPIYGIKKWNFKKQILLFKSFNFRYAHYSRSDGLKANSYSIDMNFTF